MNNVLQNLGLLVVFILVGGGVGITLIMLAATLLPKILEKFTPALDEEKEIARGNRAVAEYFGRVVSAGILGMSIIVAAAVLGGIIAALY